MTLEAEAIFPKKPLSNSPGFLDKAFVGLSASLFGMHSAVETSTDYAWADDDYANFQVYAVRSSETYPSNRDVHFVLSASNVNDTTEGIFTKIVTDVYKEVYENQKWNFAVKVKPERYPNIGEISGSSDGVGYTVEFFGVCTFNDQIIHQFALTESINQANGIQFATNRKRIYAGAHRTNFTGSLLTKTDARISSCRYWSIPLENEEIVSHAIDPKNFGVFNAMESSYLLQTAPSAFPQDIAKINTLALHWDFDTVTGSDSNGQFIVQDYSSGSDDARYGDGFSNLLLKQHTGRGDFFATSSQTAVSREYVQSYRQQVPENLNSYTSVNILSRDDELFTTRTKPIKFTYAVEKSMYQTISEEMINFMAAASDASAMENLIGDPVNKYRANYKALEKIRNIFFERVQNTPDLDKYLDYFKWLDSAVSEMVEKLAPASARINEVSNVVESHLFERGGKYAHRFPTMHFGSNDPSGSIRGINELLYDWEFGHAPISLEQDENCLWWNKRALRDDASLAIGNDGVDTDRTRIHSASVQVFNRRFNSPYRITAIDGGGSKKTQRNIKSIVMTETVPLNNDKGLSFNTGTFLSSSDCSDLDKIDPNRKYRTDYQVTFRDNDGKVLPGKLVGNYEFVSSSVEPSDGEVPSGYTIDSQHLQDYYSLHKEIPIQGPFTEQHVGGNSHRHEGLNIGVATERPEGYVVNTSVDSDGNIQYNVVNPSYNDVNAPRADYTRDFVAKSAVNIKNIQTNTASIQNEYGSLVAEGNYVNDYEIVQIPGRDINNRYLAENGGIDTTFATSSIVFGLEDYEVPDRGRNSSIMVSRFSAPGGPEVNSPAYLDAESETYSIYNVLPFRNLSVRRPMNTLLTRHSNFGGIDSVLGSPSASYQKTQRNGAKRIVSSSSGYSTASVYDNYWVQHMIPQSDLQYSWITASAIQAPFGYSKKDFSNASEASTDILFVTASLTGAYRENGELVPVDFVGLNSVVLNSVDNSSNLIEFTSSTDLFPANGELKSTLLLNSINLNTNGPGGFSSWKQVRQSYNPIVRNMNKTNRISFVTGETLESYTESPVTFRFKPMEHQFVLKNGDTINIKSSYGNNLHSFSDPNIVSKLNIGPVKIEKLFQLKAGIGQTYDDLKAIYIYQQMDSDFSPFAIDDFGANRLEFLKYSEDIYPAGNNVGLSKVRGRENYTVATGSENFEVNLGDSIAFWKDNIDDRQRTNDVARNAQGLLIASGSSYFGISDLSIWPLDAEEPFYDLEHHSASGDAAYTLAQQGYDPFYYSPLGPSGAQLDPDVEPRWNDVTKNGELSYAGWIYNLLNIQIQGKVRYDDGNGPGAPTGSGPIEVKTYYVEASPTASFQFEYPNMIWSGSIAYTSDYYAATGPRPSASLHLIPPYRANVLSGRSPWFDSYEDYAKDIRSFGKDFSVLPEFRISEHIDYYLSKGAKSINKKYATLVGASTDVTASADGEELSSLFNKDFINTYQMSDFMKHFKIIKEDHNKEVGGVKEVDTIEGEGGVPTSVVTEKTRKAAKFSKIKLECEGIKKLLPYQGFYPALRAVQLGHLFADSYGPYITGSNTRLEIEPSRAESEQGVSMERLAALYQPFFAPGIFFNTIKSGIAVDYAVHTGSQPQVQTNPYFRVSSPFSGAGYPMNQFGEGPNYVFPFEAIVNPDRFLPISSSEIGPDTNVPSASVYFVYPHFTGSTVTVYNENFYARDGDRAIFREDQGFNGIGSASGSGAQPIYFEWLGQSDVKYSLAANNFFAEVQNFFLEKRSPTSFVSQAEKSFKTMTSGSSYYMDVVLYKTDDFISYEGPSGSFSYDPYGGDLSRYDQSAVNLLGDGKRYEKATATITTATGFANGETITLVDSDGTSHLFTLDNTITYGAGGNPSYSGTGKVGISGISTANDFASAIAVAVTGSSASGATGFDSSVATNVVTVETDKAGSDGNQTNSETLSGDTVVGDFINGSNPNPVSARGIHYGPPYRSQQYAWGLKGTGSAWFEDPSYAIHTPPYFYGDAIARIEFKPHEARDLAEGESAKFTLQEILANAKVNTSYRNKNQRAKALQNDDYRNDYPAGRSQMQISSSVNLFGQITLKEVQYKNQKDAAGNFIPDGATTPVIQDSQDAWVIESKFECPSVNLFDMDVDSLGAGAGLGKEKYYTKGIWKGYGRPSSGSSGIYMQIRESFGPKTYAIGGNTEFNPSAKTPLTGSLIDVCGFKADQQRVGEIADNRELSEAIVAIPVDGKGMPFNISTTAYKTQIQNMKNGDLPVLAGQLDSEKDVEETSISRMYNLMQKYYIPPDMDFSKEDNFSTLTIKPFVMYIFEFTHTLSKEDLSYIWQNLMPDISIKAEKQKSVFEHEIGPAYEFFGTLGEQGFPDNVRWKVFKVKKRARNNYFNITKTSERGNGFAFTSQTELAGFSSDPEAELPFSYNWPYDFCSLVELAKVNSEVTFEPEE
jgi:hypothetical protein